MLPLRLPLEHHLRPNEEEMEGPRCPGLPAFVRLTGRAERGWMLARPAGGPHPLPAGSHRPSTCEGTWEASMRFTALASPVERGP